ncbi:hypothetical protein KUTeg_019158 [Tegillarca granosa]|uniref:Uncharacterized protein n=1 Tax=Tegillarca granosa TaxID=220873 RepID=A0ABQ9EFS2_TEGGR|nr:hypothetical protein KUTeg_019158 [Tegillarca granosa]
MKLKRKIGIEQLKKEQPGYSKKSKWLNIKAVFGHPFSWKWFSPFSEPKFVYNQSYLYSCNYIFEIFIYVLYIICLEKLLSKHDVNLEFVTFFVLLCTNL